MPQPITARGAYSKGWDAYGRGTILGDGEQAFIARYGAEFHDAYIGGYLDRNSDRPKYHDFDCPIYNGGGDCPEPH